MATLRLIQVGMGGWGQDWLQHVVQLSQDVELVACVDADPAMIKQVQRRLVASTRCLTSFEQALAEVDADAVLITASLAGHVPLALASLAAGKHVLLEKPFAPTMAEARRVVDAAAERGRVLMISQNYRFFPAVRVATALLREGTLGEVNAVSVEFRRYANSAAAATNRHYRIAQPLLMDMAIHHFDLMRMVLGQEPRQVACHAWNPPWSQFAEPAAAAATVTFERGAVVSYRGSWVSTAPQTAWAGEWRMECAGGEIRWTSRGNLDARVDRVFVQPRGRAARRVTLPELPHIDRAGSLAAFAQAIRDGVEPESSGRDNLGSVALMYAMIESATSGLQVPVQAAQG